MYCVLLAVSPIDLCRAINVSSERNRQGERVAQEAREKFTHCGRRLLPAFAKSTRNERMKLERVSIQGDEIAKGAANRSRGNVSELPSYLPDGAKKIQGAEGKKTAENRREESSSGRLDGSSGRHASFKVTFLSLRLSVGRISTSLTRVEIADRSRVTFLDEKRGR